MLSFSNNKNVWFIEALRVYGGHKQLEKESEKNKSGLTAPSSAMIIDQV